LQQTPASKVRGTLSGDYLTPTGVEKKRTIIATRDIPQMIPEIPIDFFLEKILPLPHSLIDKTGHILKTLRSRGAINEEQDRWSAFSIDPVVAAGQSKKYGDESVVFQPMEKIFKAVVDAAKENDDELQQTFEFLVTTGHPPMYSDRGAGDAQPDGFNKIVAASTESNHHFVYDIANPCQFKTTDRGGNINDNVMKLIYDMTQILSLDPCRRFTFGTTIEDCSTRLWFLSHATLLKTTPFDFMRDRPRLIRLFLSLAFASPTKMGWDPTITFDHTSDDDRRQYRIEVNGKSYTTDRILSDIAADSPLGRATRVWKVVDDVGHVHVLKDVWLDHSRTEEHLIREEILKAVRDLDDGERFVERLKKHMLTPIAYGKVRVDEETDDTSGVMLAGYDPKEDEMVPLIPPTTISSRNTRRSTGMSMPSDRDSVRPLSSPGFEADESVESSSETPRPRRAVLDDLMKQGGNRLRHHRRYHYRVVFKEFATTIYEEKSCNNVFHAIADVVKALWILHKAGWVHRDISGGNLYWYEEERVGLIGDFEYARVIKGDGHHDVRTGTPFFMAAETLAQKYLFKKTEEILNDPGEGSTPDFDNPWPDSLDQPVLGSTTPSTSQQLEHIDGFHHNPLHDLESIWWVIVYIVFFNDDAEELSPKPKTRQDVMDQLFNGRLEYLHRLSFFNESDRLREARQYLSSNFGCHTVDILEEYRTVLQNAYRKSERNYPPTIDDTSFFIHSSLLKPVLQNPVYVVPLSKITLVPVKANLKRKGDTQQDGRSSKRSRYVNLTSCFLGTC
ncbi:hypothetical protein EV360DRAFT_33772, partial [Lentinula raphanica]